MRRPFGLRAIIFLLLLQAGIGAAILLFYLFGGQEVQQEFTKALSQTQSPVTLLLSQALLLCLRLVVVVGLWRLRRWAWFLMMLLTAYAMAADALAFLQGQPEYWTMFINVVTVFYLNLREVQNLFLTRGETVTT